MTSKAESKIAWGQLAQLPNMDAILSSCQALEAEEEPVNRENVAKRSGVRHNNQLAAGIKLYRERREWTDRYEVVPPALTHLVLQSLEKAFTDLSSVFDQRVDTAVSEYKQVAEALSKDVEAALEMSSQLEQRLLEKEQYIQQLEEESGHVDKQKVAEVEQRYCELDEKYRASLEQVRQLEQQLKNEHQRASLASREHQSALEKLSVDHRGALETLLAQQEGERKRLMQESDEKLAVSREQNQRLEGELKALQKALEGHVNQLNSLEQEREIFARELQLKSEALEKGRTYQQSLEAYQVALDKQVASLQTQLESLETHYQKELSRLECMVSTLSMQNGNQK